MIIYASKTFTATRSGVKLEEVECEKCNARFAYELRRTGVATATAPYFLFQGFAQRRADRAAARDLTRRLARDAELVACPTFGWVNDDLIARYRRMLYRRTPAIAGLLLLGGVAISAIIYFSRDALSDKRHPPTLEAPLRVLGGTAVLIAAMFIARFVLRRRIDPNALFPRPTPLPPGTPPALLATPNGFSAAAVEDRAPPAPPEWAIVPPDTLVFPPNCCICLAPTSAIYRAPMKIDSRSDLPVPVCPRCSDKLRRRWWPTLLIAATVSAGLGELASRAGRVDELGRIFAFGLVMTFGLIFGVCIATLIARPYRVRSVDARRGIVRFAAPNPAYTALVAERVDAQLRQQLP